MSKKDLFFEEDPKADGNTEMSWEEHDDTFFGVLKNEGIISDRKDASMAPIGVTSEMSVKVLRTTLVEVEYGVIKEDYVIHVTPTHPQRNLSNSEQIYNIALKACVVAMNKEVPPDLKVDIFPPQPNWEIKATSFVIRDGATAWNLDHAKLEADVVPRILNEVTAICAKG